MFERVLNFNINGGIFVGSEEGCEQSVDIALFDNLAGERDRAIVLQFLAGVSACCNSAFVQFLNQLMIRFVLGNALFQDPDLVKPVMLLKVRCLAIDKICSLVNVFRTIISLWHWG